jgi:glycosyltransferase involved in cell wall biosynthesis
VEDRRLDEARLDEGRQRVVDELRRSRTFRRPSSRSSAGGPLHQRLEREAEEAGVRDRVVLAGVRADARAVMGAADAVLLPSVWEGLPLVGLEALAAGTPLVATAARESASSSPTARPPSSSRPATSAFEQAIERVLDDRELAHRLRRNGLELAAAHSQEAMLARYHRLYGEILR